MPIQHQLYLATGSNQGNSLELLRKCNQLIVSRIGNLQRVSPIYLTKAWGKTDQPDFLNQVILVETVLTPLLVFKEIQAIEKQLGRKRFEKWGPRTIDIDILFYDQLVLDHALLQIPHPEIAHRNFVLKPLLDINAKLVHPTLNQSIMALWQHRTDTLEVTPYD